MFCLRSFLMCFLCNSVLLGAIDFNFLCDKLKYNKRFVFLTFLAKEGGAMITKERAAEIIDNTHARLCDFCVSKCGCTPDETDELVQEAFCVFIEKLGLLQDHGDEKMFHWLCSTVKNKRKEMFREKKRQYLTVPLDEVENNLDAVLMTMDSYFFETPEEIEAIKEKILNNLTPTQFAVYKKVFEEEKTYQEAAEELGMTEKNVAVNVSRIKKRVRLMGLFMFSSFGNFIIKALF